VLEVIVSDREVCLVAQNKKILFFKISFCVFVKNNTLRIAFCILIAYHDFEWLRTQTDVEAYCAEISRDP